MAENESKKGKFSLRKLIYNDKYLIIISILLALIIWVVTSINLSPETTKTVNVSFTPDFSDTAVEQLGLKCYGDEKIDIEVTISCKKYLAKDITADDLNVYLQSNAVTSSGTYDVPIRVGTEDNAEFAVTSYYPTAYRAYFDVEDEKTMDVNIQYANEDFIADGYAMGEPLLSESTVTVKGPRTYVSQVASVTAIVNIEKPLTSTTSMDLTANALDSNGSDVNYITIETGGENLTITIPVLREMQLDVVANFAGKPSNLDMSDFDISYSVDRVNAGVLEDADISQAVIGSIDFSKLNTGENQFTFNVDSLDGFVILDNIHEIRVTVNVPSDYTKKTVSVSSDNIRVINAPKGYNADIVNLSTDEVTVIGTEENLENISSSSVSLVVDLSGLDTEDIKTGTSSYKLTTALSNSDTCWIYGSYTANVNIYEK